jgi:hypothetical protein
MCHVRVVRLANPLLRAVLRSHWHRVLSGRLLVLTYAGHRSGRTFSIPLRYAELPDRRVVIVAVRPRRKLWWRSFAAPLDATALLRGRHVTVVGRLVDGEARDEALAAYDARYRRSAHLVRDAAVVVLEPSR